MHLNAAVYSFRGMAPRKLPRWRTHGVALIPPHLRNNPLHKPMQRQIKRWMHESHFAHQVASQSLPPVLRKADPAKFSISRENEHTYRDHPPGGGLVTNDLAAVTAHGPHWVLKDARGSNRAVLYALFSGNRIDIRCIQGERSPSSYVENPEFGKTSHSFLMQERWNFLDKKEKESTAELKQELGGVSPGEFLLVRFLWEHREQIRGGKRIVLFATRKRMKAYGPLIDRYFSKPPEYKDKGNVVFLFPLNLNKKRVKEILGVE